MVDPVYYADEHFLDLFSSVAEEAEDAVSLISELSGNGKLLELGLGTGRLALPLARMGHDITGIEASTKAIESLQEKRDSEKIKILRGDLAVVEWGTECFDLIYAPFGIWEVLGTAERQRTVLSNAAEALLSGGHLLVEGYVPTPNRFDHANQTVEVRHASLEKIVLLIAEHDPVAQNINSYFVLLRNGANVEILGEPKHYMHLSELDLEADSRGLELAARWGDWRKSDYTGAATHLSLYRRR